jgi:ABC-type branched-subunit amino acid transport system ATPase component
MLPNEIAISVKGLKKSYKNVAVLEGVDFEVKTGSIFALLGSNGTGKTTDWLNSHHAAKTGRNSSPANLSYTR